MTPEQVISELRKDPDQEALLQRVNDLLLPVESKLESEYSEPSKPVVFIIGAPRSGTTLTSQVLSHTGAFGYISNFVARFWQAPFLGVLLQEALEIGDDRSASNFESDYGVTKGWAEPHEFGYFWSRWFDFGSQTNKLRSKELDRVDRDGLRQAVAALEAAFGRPLVFKNPTWVDFQIEYLAEVFPTSIFLLTEREPVYVTQSILLQRERHLGRRDLWLSMKPSDYPRLRNLPWYDQIAGQVHSTTVEMNRALARLPDERIIRSSYDEGCRCPESLVLQVFDAIEQMVGFRPSIEHGPPKPFEVRDYQRICDRDFNLLSDAYARCVREARV